MCTVFDCLQCLKCSQRFLDSEAKSKVKVEIDAAKSEMFQKGIMKFIVLD